MANLGRKQTFEEYVKEHSMNDKEYQSAVSLWNNAQDRQASASTYAKVATDKDKSVEK
jgi:hypothetical protein